MSGTDNTSGTANTSSTANTSVNTANDNVRNTGNSDIGLSEVYDAWNPGISSQIPAHLQSEITLFRPDNSRVSFERACELADFCGLQKTGLVLFRVERLVVHELLVRVTSDLSVPDGPNYEDLGISLRAMVSTLYQGHVQPVMTDINAAYNLRINTAKACIKDELSNTLFASPAVPEPKPGGSLLARLFGKKQQVKSRSATDEPGELIALRSWRNQLNMTDSPDERYCLEALVKVVDSLVAHRGRVLHEPELISDLALSFAANKIGEEVVSVALDNIFHQAVKKESYRLLPTQTHPVVMNVKGASASGKSTIRPQQRQLAGKLGIPWEDFALVSPDYWRKYLLDYESLGKHAKYAAMLTGQELEIIDKKLDRYMAKKAAEKRMSHLLIDRFRFDSFSVDAGKSQDSKLLSRFGDRIYLFFMVTPPAETVVRAWERGKTTGRYKAVDDLLYHNIEAYTGIPELFLSWVLSADKKIHFEFLDNDVPKGRIPRTAAFGCNQKLIVADPLLMRNIDRYRNVNIEAKNADDVLPDQADSAAEFLHRCVTRIADVQFLDQHSGVIYAAFSNGQLVWCNLEQLGNQKQREFVSRFLDGFTKSENALASAPVIDIELVHQDTLGRLADSL